MIHVPIYVKHTAVVSMFSVGMFSSFNKRLYVSLIFNQQGASIRVRQDEHTVASYVI